MKIPRGKKTELTAGSVIPEAAALPGVVIAPEDLAGIMNVTAATAQKEVSGEMKRAAKVPAQKERIDQTKAGTTASALKEVLAGKMTGKTGARPATAMRGKGHQEAGAA